MQSAWMPTATRTFRISYVKFAFHLSITSLNLTKIHTLAYKYKLFSEWLLRPAIYLGGRERKMDGKTADSNPSFAALKSYILIHHTE